MVSAGIVYGYGSWLKQDVLQDVVDRILQHQTQTAEAAVMILQKLKHLPMAVEKY